jgi:tRNA-modifying protein YgfZ
MSSPWHDFLSTKSGAAIGNGAVLGFGRPAEELRAARDASIVAPLSALGRLAVGGDDAAGFLHGQFSSDVKALQPGRAQRSSYCSPKGRVLANFLLWRDASGFGALLSRELAEPVRKRLAMFVLRSKVTIADVSGGSVILGLSGPAAARAIEDCIGPAPAADDAAVAAPTGTVIAIGGGRFIAVLKPDAAPAAWVELSAKLAAVGEPAWRWLDIRAGVPWIGAATQDQFVPQMANLELIGAVNFQKGCYTGQEIVARTQYLGKLKRRLFGFHADADAPSAGTPLYAADFPDQACGMVVDAAPAPDGGCDLLAVTQAESAGKARLGSPDGPALGVFALPYAVPLPQ